MKSNPKEYLFIPQPYSTNGGLYSVGYNAWPQGLDGMFDALEAEGMTILVDTRHSDYRAKHSFDQLARAAQQRGIRYTSRPSLSGKPRDEGEYTPEGYADYTKLDQREGVGAMLDGMVKAAHKGERIALLCACADTCTCHRTRWLAQSLGKRGVDVGHIEPGEYDPQRHQEEGIRELYGITPHASLPDLPDHSDKNWAGQAVYWKERRQPQPIPQDYQSPTATKAIPNNPRQVLIAGSMKANPAQLNYASSLVVRAAEVGAQIHVGDNDQGVDARVVATANRLGYSDVVVWTAGDNPRNGGVAGGQIRKVPYNERLLGNRFSQRDRTMIRSLDAEQGAAFFLSNGETHYRNGRITGTEAGYVFAVEQGQAARKIAFDRPQDRTAALKSLPTEYQPQPTAPASPPDPEEVQPELPQPSMETTPATPEPRPSTMNHVQRWQLAHAESQSLTQARSLTQASLWQARPNERGADLIQLQTLPIADLEGQTLGYAVAGVDANWRASPFKPDTSDWRGADTFRLHTLAHFSDRTQAQNYATDLQDFMGESALDNDPAQARDFLRAVGRVNGLKPGLNQVNFVSWGVGDMPQHRDQIAALQAQDWTLPLPDFAFKPSSYLSPPNIQLQSAQTVDGEGQALGYSALALRPATQPEQPSHALELARFEKQSDAEQYVAVLSHYIEAKEGLTLAGTPQQQRQTETFLQQIAESNGLAGTEQAVEPDVILGQKVFHPEHNFSMSALKTPHEQASFAAIIDR